jgi:hypothetical protein
MAQHIDRGTKRLRGERILSSTRRGFLKGTTTLAGGLLAASLTKGSESRSLPTIALGPHQVTRLIAGGNPLFGYSHTSGLLDRFMREYFTDQQVVQFMLDCERAGINAWQSNYPAPLERQLPLIRQAGCKLQWIALADPWDIDRSAITAETIWATAQKCVVRAAKHRPVAVALRGIETDQLWKERKLEVVRDFVNYVHDAGFLAGVSAHHPTAVETLESKGWPIDFYMTCFYRVTRTPEDFRQEIGMIPVGETYLAADPERMCRVIRQAAKPCLGFKILAAGRRCDSAEQVREAFAFAFQNLKPTDGVIVGMFPRFSDQIGENVRLVRELGA